MKVMLRCLSCCFAATSVFVTALFLVVILQATVQAVPPITPGDPNHTPACSGCSGQCDDSNVSDCYYMTSCTGNNCGCSCDYYQAGMDGLPYSTCACT